MLLFAHQVDLSATQEWLPEHASSFGSSSMFAIQTMLTEPLSLQVLFGFDNNP
jgi:hypothetical protein